MTHTMTTVMGTPNRVVQALRDTFFPLVARLAPFQHALVQRLSELDIGYSGSPIVRGSGKRYFDDSMRGGTGIRSRFLLLLNEDSGSATKEEATRLRESFPEILELRMARRPRVTLVRPDGYVAYESQDEEPGAVAAAGALLELQTERSS